MDLIILRWSNQGSSSSGRTLLTAKRVEKTIRDPADVIHNDMFTDYTFGVAHNASCRRRQDELNGFILAADSGNGWSNR